MQRLGSFFTIPFSVLFLFSFSTTQGHELPSSSTESQYIESHRFEPCDSWNYSFETRSYHCRNTSFAIRVPDSGALNNYIVQLESRIQSLEQRILALEAK